MGTAVVTAVTIILLALIGFWAIRWWGRRRDRQDALREGLPVQGDLNARQERGIMNELDEAAKIFRYLKMPHDEFDEITILGKTASVQVDQWLKKHESAKGTR